ncbi:MAG: hypothetical protein JO353_05805 [Phycisphaerae bacterium]|nr:hypothetical protein [Phycisphaerae bacterium]
MKKNGRLSILLPAILLPAILLVGGFISMAAAQSPATAPSNSPDASASDMLDRMLKPAGQAPAPLQPITYPAQTNQATAAVAPGATTQPTVREGTFVVDRTGRLSKSADGQQVIFTFDSDGRAMQDPPLIILPNLKLEVMEQAVAGSNRDLRFRVTGMLTEYRNHNYLLLDKVVVIPDVVQQF